MNSTIRRQSLIAIVLFSMCNICMPQESPGLKSSEQAMRFVKVVQKRYYLVHRLEKPMRFLMDFYESIQQNNQFNFWHLMAQRKPKELILPIGISAQFQHPAVKKCMKTLEEEHNIRAIHSLWSDLLSYKFIENELFVREAIIAIVVLYKAVISMVTKEGQGQKAENVKSWEEMYDNFDSILNLLDESYDKGDFVITNNLRYYHIQRLLKSIVILTQVNTRYLNPLWDCLVQTINKNNISFKHEAVQRCLDSILETESFEPLFGLWHHFMAYRFANDSLFLQEFVALEYMLYRKLIDCLRVSVGKANPTADDIIELYANIATLPIPEMLNSLDSLVDDLIAIMEKYELDTTLSWKDWLIKYWWVPPVVLASIVVNFILDHRSNQAMDALF